MLLAALLGCALHTSRAGLIDVEGGAIDLRDYQGRTWRLHVDEVGAPLRYMLPSVVVEVEGPRLFRSIWVEDWFVQDAGDGSSGFVGTLREYGTRLVVDDRNTKRTLVIQDGTSPELRAHAGETVLLRGYVVGPEIIRVSDWFVLAPAK